MDRGRGGHFGDRRNFRDRKDFEDEQDEMNLPDFSKRPSKKIAAFKIVLVLIEL